MDARTSGTSVTITKMIKCFQGNSIKSRSSVQDGQTESAEEEQWFLTVVDDRR